MLTRSALPPKADINSAVQNVCFVPKADILKMTFSFDPETNHAGEMPVRIHFQNCMMDPSATTWVWYR